MLWWFEREGRHTTIEVLDLPNGEYELRFVDEAGVERIERFANASELAKRQHAIQETLVTQGWARSGQWMM